MYAIRSYYDSNDELPMWSGSTIYYLSDNGKEKRNNIWAYNTQTKTNEQLTRFSDMDVRFPSIGPDDLIFQAGSDMYLMDLATKKYKKVKIEVVTDQMATMPKTVKVERYLQSAAVSPDSYNFV